MLDTADLLFELGTEELPPKALKNMAQKLLENVSKALDELEIGYQAKQFYASPRRLSFVIEQLQTTQKDKLIDKEGPFIDKAYDADGKPTKAALGFAKSCGVSFDKLTTIEHSKGARLFYQVAQKGQKTKEIIADIIDNALKKLPIPKMMRWGDEEYQFVRPVHWAILLLADELVDASFYGCKTSHISYGHRFHAPDAIHINDASDYVRKLETAYVLVDWQVRKEKVVTSAKALAGKHQANAVLNDDLVEEVTAIVEYPHALLCDFDQRFLRVPQEALISAMEEHQKCFALVDDNNKMINHFITMSNIASSNPQTVIKGNNKVMAARLSDAAFFYDTDVKKPLETYVEKLKVVTFQKALGSVFDRTTRIALLAQTIAKMIGADEMLAHRAGYLSKADLMTDMVYEFTDLQGIIGKYYAKAHGEDDVVCQAIEEQYWPKYAGDKLPQSKIAQALAIAEKMDTLVGIFGIGQKPTGDKDPFALRRAAIGVLRILKEHHLAISLSSLIELSINTFQAGQLTAQANLKDSLKQFFIDRLKVIYKEEGVVGEIFEAVKAVDHADVADFDARVNALLTFKSHTACERLAQSNKRVANILAKNAINEANDALSIDQDLLQEAAETNLFDALQSVESKLSTLISDKRYQEALLILSTLDEPIAEFFEHVMVITEDEKIKNNRLAILQKIAYLFRQVADLSVL
ncbi:glycine--tRNA ligase subunit beta [Cysteiniphilum litorale]|uniref:glycine--tRNA ligase subunit beta n=1 Tax=Cysteiniphilum litorale TaxID=2056700 RepID=UPI003F8813A5